MNQSSLLVSGYTVAPYGSGPGLVRYQLTDDGGLGHLLGEANGLVNPSFLALSEDGSQLFACSETADGGVVALDATSLGVLGSAQTGGADPCHVMVSNARVWAANYSSGSAARLDLSKLIENAAQTPDLVQHLGKGAVPGRQDESHAHQCIPTPWGTVLVTDLGADRVDEYDAQTLQLVDSAELPPGTGPRHAVLSGDLLFIAGELDGHLHTVQRKAKDKEQDTHDAGASSWKWLHKVPLAPNAASIEEAKEFFPSHLVLQNGLIYAAVRGPNTLVVLDARGLSGEGAEPASYLTQLSCGGNWARHFALNATHIYVANQLSNNIAVFPLDPQGIPVEAAGQSIEFGSPTCVVLS